MNKIVCRINKNHLAQFEKLDEFVVFNFGHKLDGRTFGTYELTIRKQPITRTSRNAGGGIVCRINKNHLAQFEKLDGFVVFNFTRELDARKYGTYELTIRKQPTTRASRNAGGGKQSKPAERKI
jgi:ribosomal protein L35AE/L33A